jgi:hypothetical protein
MFSLLAFLALAADEPLTKELPPVKEPDWTVWKKPEPKAKQAAMNAWTVLRDHRPDRKYKTQTESQQAMQKVLYAYKTLEQAPEVTCATGTELLKTANDDWGRIMIATLVGQLGGKKGEPFLVWAMGNSSSVEDVFEPVYEIASRLAARRKSEYLPAIFLILRTHEGQIFLPLHSWYIRTHDCLYYVLGRYGRDVIPYLRSMLKHKDPYVRRNAAIALGYFLDKASKPTFRKMLEANDIGSGGAAFALGELGDTGSAKAISKLLKNPDAKTRFWVAYGLYELGSKEGLPALEAALKDEKDRDTLHEIQVAIDHIRKEPKPFGEKARKLNKDELSKALKAAKEANGLQGDLESIAASGGSAELRELEEIRLKTMDIPSDKGNKWFQDWTTVIKTVRRRVE